MEHPYPVIEFEAEIGPEGTLRLPAHLVPQLPEGHRIVVRMTLGVVGSLRERGVTESEIEEISVRQYEHRENVVAFLHGEGALHGNEQFRRRGQQLFGMGG